MAFLKDPQKRYAAGKKRAGDRKLAAEFYNRVTAAYNYRRRRHPTVGERAHPRPSKKFLDVAGNYVRGLKRQASIRKAKKADTEARSWRAAAAPMAKDVVGVMRRKRKMRAGIRVKK